MEASWERAKASGAAADRARESGASGHWERLGHAVARRRMPRWDATVGAVVGTNGVLVIDTGATPDEGAEIQRQVRGHFGRPVRWVALTHPHFDHVLGTAAFAEAEVYAAMGVAETLAHGAGALLEDAVGNGLDRETATAAVKALPSPRHPVSEIRTLQLGGGQRALLVPLGPGHTGHDMAVLVPGTRGDPAVLFCGDVVEESGEPQAGPDAQPRHWPAVLDRLLSLGGDQALYVPGHGAVVDATFVREQRATLARRFGVAP